jgi:hypothetical protein
MAICLSLGVVIGIIVGKIINIECTRGEDYMTIQCVN